MSTAWFAICACALVLSFIGLAGSLYEHHKQEVKPTMPLATYHVKLWMVDNNTVEFDGPYQEMHEILNTICKQEFPFIINGKSTTVVINPKHVIQCGMYPNVEVVKP